MGIQAFFQPSGRASRWMRFGLCLATLGILAMSISARAQSSTPATTTQPSGAQPQTSQPDAPDATQPKPVKVWTNEEVGALHNQNSISVVGQKSSTKKVSAVSGTNSQEKNPDWYQKQLAPLREDIEKIGPQIARLQDFLNGENISDTPTMHRQLVPSPSEQLKQLEAKRQADQVKIDDLLDRARKNGVEPGALR
jgi:hypothetical protein